MADMINAPEGVTLIPDSDSTREFGVIAEQTALQSKEVAEAAKKIGEELNELNKNSPSPDQQEKDRKSTSELLEQAFDKTRSVIGDSILGPFNLLVKPLEEGLGINMGDKIKEGLFGNKMNPEKGNLLAKGGVIGSAAVYLGNVLGKSLDEMAPEKDGIGDSLIEGFAQGSTSMVSKLLTGLGVALPAAIGIGLAGWLKREDIMGGISQMKEGEVLRGLETLLLGDRDKVTDENAAGLMGRQGLAYGAGALGVGTTIAAGSAVAGGATLGTALVTGLVAALPPALIAAGVAATAKGIQAAWVNEWDTRSEEIVNSTRDVLGDEGSTLWDKIKAVMGLGGKMLFGSFVGGIKGALGNLQDRFQSVKDVFGDEESSFLQKAFTVLKEFNIFGIMGDTIKGFVKGQAGVFADYLKKLLPDRILNIFMNIGDFVENVYERSIGKLKSKASSLASKGADALGEFFGNAFSFIRDSAMDIFNTAKSLITSSAWFQSIVEISQKVGEFFGDYFTAARDFISEKFQAVKGAIATSPWYIKMTEILDTIQNFFGDLFDNILGFMSKQFDKIKTTTSNLFAKVEFEREALALNKDERANIENLIATEFGGDIAAFNQAFSGSGMDGAFKGLGQLFDKEGNVTSDALKKLLDASASTSVEDAIITSSGEVIRTAQDDNIIATKNQPKFLSEEMSALNEQTIIPETTVQSSMLMELKNLVKILTEKSFNNIVMSEGTGSSIDFDSIRSER